MCCFVRGLSILYFFFFVFFQQIFHCRSVFLRLCTTRLYIHLHSPKGKYIHPNLGFLYTFFTQWVYNILGFSINAGQTFIIEGQTSVNAGCTFNNAGQTLNHASCTFIIEGQTLNHAGCTFNIAGLTLNYRRLHLQYRGSDLGLSQVVPSISRV